MKRNRQLRGSWVNIQDTLHRASPKAVQAGIDWYPIAHEIAIEVGNLVGYKGDIALQVGAGMLSAMSPSREWGGNVQDAKLVARGLHAPMQYGDNLIKAERIRDGESPLDVLGGLKVIPFYFALCDPRGDDPIPVVDRHASHVYKGARLTDYERRKLSNVRVMNRIQGAYRKVARKEGLHVHALQGITWVQCKVENGDIQV